jgi:hypothetical protein
VNHTSTPKHGKRHENRLWSRDRRGDGKRQERDGGINPDGSISVAAVCGNEVRVYSEAKAGRRLRYAQTFATHGAARLWAHEHDDAERQPRR